jgi:hypothetical protein
MMLRMILAPGFVFREPQDKVKHFYLWGILTALNIFLVPWEWLKGIIIFALLFAAIVKEQVFDKTPDPMDTYYSFFGTIWFGIVSLIIRKILIH